jgi:hypothetical protein
MVSDGAGSVDLGNPCFRNVRDSDEPDDEAAG